MRDMMPYDSNYKMKPPLRSTCDVKAVVEGVVNGAIDAIATDHAPHAGSEKMQEFESCPFGIHRTRNRDRHCARATGAPAAKSGSHAWSSCSRIGPARILGLDRGTLASGRAGGCHHFLHGREWTYDVNKSFSKSRNSPFDGKTFSGGPVATVVAGE